MRATLERIVTQYERGTLSRRELIAGLAALCAAPGPAAAGIASPDGQEKLTPIPLGGLDHVALRVSDLPRSLQFYQEHLGGRVRSQSSSSAFLDIGNHWVALFARGVASTGFAATPPGVDHISFHSTQHRSVEERLGVLRAHGLAPVSPAGSGRVYFRDPDGVILQLS